MCRLKTLDEQDRIRAQKEKARNALETFVIDMQNNIYSEDYEKAVTQEEKEKILESCSLVRRLKRAKYHFSIIRAEQDFFGF